MWSALRQKWQGGPADSTGAQQPNLLQMFYSDPSRWAFTFQTFAFVSRAQQAMSAMRVSSFESYVGLIA